MCVWVCACVRVCVRACVRACVRVCVCGWVGGVTFALTTKVSHTLRSGSGVQRIPLGKNCLEWYN